MKKKIRKTGKGIRKTDSCTLHMADGLVTVEVFETPTGDICVRLGEHGADGPKILVGLPDSDGNIHFRFWKP